MKLDLIRKIRLENAVNKNSQRKSTLKLIKWSNNKAIVRLQDAKQEFPWVNATPFTLCTVDLEGNPNARTVLLQSFKENGASKCNNFLSSAIIRISYFVFRISYFAFSNLVHFRFRSVDLDDFRSRGQRTRVGKKWFCCCFVFVGLQKVD